MSYRRNHESYPDPTAGEALEHIAREEKRQKRWRQVLVREERPDTHQHQRYVNRPQKGRRK